MRKVLLFTVIFSLIGVISLVSCQKENFDTEKEVICAEVFLQTFEEKLNLVFQAAEVGLQSDSQQGFEHLFRSAYTEVLGNYAFADAFDNGLLEVSLESRAVRTRSMEEVDSEALLLQVINASETIEEAIGRFEELINDVSFCVEDRVNFISLREFLIFFERNEEDIIAQIESSDNFVRTRTSVYDRNVIIKEESGGGFWRCVVGAYGSYLTGGLGGCVGGGSFGSIFGGIIGAAIGCAVGGIVGGIAGTMVGIATFC